MTREAELTDHRRPSLWVCDESSDSDVETMMKYPSCGRSDLDRGARSRRHWLRWRSFSCSDGSNDPRRQFVGRPLRLPSSVRPSRRRSPESSASVCSTGCTAAIGHAPEAVRLPRRKLLLVGHDHQRAVRWETDPPGLLDVLDAADGDPRPLRHERPCPSEPSSAPTARDRARGGKAPLPPWCSRGRRSDHVRHSRPSSLRRSSHRRCSRCEHWFQREEHGRCQPDSHAPLRWLRHCGLPHREVTLSRAARVLSTRSAGWLSVKPWPAPVFGNDARAHIARASGKIPSWTG